ncbi:major facilitator superfamily domain-containing protein [Globomyces pollinis-pini]|nr:major facilitator superfamily domain-containing protein [Globomyces pollinis-pini]
MTRRGYIKTTCLLFLTGIITSGNYYCYDIPAALNVPLQKWLETNYADYQTQINMLYSIYALPNIILPLIGGILMDKLDSNITLVIFSLLVCMGQAIFSFGVEKKQYSLMLIGRFLFGLGSETLDVGQANITTQWFHGNGLGFALGINLSFARLSTAFNDNFSPWLARSFSTTKAVWFGLVVCLISFIFTLIIWKVNSVTSKKSHSETSDILITEPLLNETIENENEVIHILDDGDEDIHHHARISVSQLDEEMEDDTIHVRQITDFNRSFWYLFIITISMYGSLVPFFHICSDFFQQKWYPGDSEKAGFVMSIPDLVSAVGSPVCGILIDRYGHRSSFMSISAILTLIGYGLLAFTSLSPYIGMFIIGITYSLFASAIWPCVPHLVGSHQIATAYGLLATALNLSLFVFPMVVAAIRNLSDPSDFVPTILFFICLATMALFCSVCLYLEDRSKGSPLENANGRRTSIASLVFENDSGDDYFATVVGDGIAIAIPHTRVPTEVNRSPVRSSLRIRSAEPYVGPYQPLEYHDPNRVAEAVNTRPTSAKV